MAKNKKKNAHKRRAKHRRQHQRHNKLNNAEEAPVDVGGDSSSGGGDPASLGCGSQDSVLVQMGIVSGQDVSAMCSVEPYDRVVDSREGHPFTDHWYEDDHMAEIWQLSQCKTVSYNNQSLV